jgi:hypothetical protein
MKKLAVKAARMTESELEEGILFMLDVYNKLKGVFDWSESTFEEIFEGIFRGLIFGVEMLVIRLEGNKGFVFISSVDEFLKFLKRRYGGFGKLIDEYNKKGGGKEISRRFVLVLSEGRFKWLLRNIERDIRDTAEGRKKLDMEHHILRYVKEWWKMVVGIIER